jgi:hypothetical protein
MGIVPEKKTEKVAYFASKTTRWAAAAPDIGTTPAAVSDLAAKVTSARAKLAAADAAREAAKAATADADLAVAEMAHAGAAIIQQIRAKAAVDGEGVYILAEIPAPRDPSPLGPPGTPTDFRAALNPDGSLTLTWKCPNPPRAYGTIYQVDRRIGAGAPFASLTSVGTRSFTDTTVPAGAVGVMYRITAVRSTKVGLAAEFVVNFGAGSAAGETGSVVSVPKLAA